MKPRPSQLAQAGATTGQALIWDGAEWAPGAVAAAAMTINNQAGAAYALALADATALVRMTNVGANTVTLPPASSVAFPTGSWGQVEQAGTGVTRLAAGAGVTIHSPVAMLGIASQYGRVVWVYLGGNVYEIEGRLQP